VIPTTRTQQRKRSLAWSVAPVSGESGLDKLGV
jgi:hypothetical protein